MIYYIDNQAKEVRVYSVYTEYTVYTDNTPDLSVDLTQTQM